MPPKRQDSGDDGLDDIEFRTPAKKAKPACVLLKPDQANAVVTELFPNQSAARLDGEAKSRLCTYKMSAFDFQTGWRERSPVCVGERVRVEAGVIVGRAERRNRIVRPAPNARNQVLHVLAANIDRLVVVASARAPEFSAGAVDRFLVAAAAQKIGAVLCVNKMDLLSPGDPRPWSHYPSAGVTLIEASVKKSAGVDALLAAISGKTAVFCGHSGVGKTSLLRLLLGDLSFGRTGEVGSRGRGRHTTTGAVLMAGPQGCAIIDTPGIMNFGLVDVDRQDLLSHFPELLAASSGCPAGCLHDAEPACAVRELPRHASYRRILASLG